MDGLAAIALRFMAAVAAVAPQAAEDVVQHGAAHGGKDRCAAGDLIATGPTGTNVMDLILGLKL